MSFAVPPVTQPPQLNPTTKVATAPAAAPCRRRLRESPRRIAGISMMFFPSPDWFGASAADARNGLRSIPSSWIEGPAALRWRFGHPHHARIVAQSRWRRRNICPDTYLVLCRFEPMLMRYLKMFLGLLFMKGFIT